MDIPQGKIPAEFFEEAAEVVLRAASCFRKGDAASAEMMMFYSALINPACVMASDAGEFRQQIFQACHVLRNIGTIMVRHSSELPDNAVAVNTAYLDELLGISDIVRNRFVDTGEFFKAFDREWYGDLTDDVKSLLRRMSVQCVPFSEFGSESRFSV